LNNGDLPYNWDEQVDFVEQVDLMEQNGESKDNGEHNAMVIYCVLTIKNWTSFKWHFMEAKFVGCVGIWWYPIMFNQIMISEHVD
jgi:hypothetical protein